MVIELIALLLIGQIPLPSVVVPPTAERTIVFQDRGRIYLVGSVSGDVKVLDTLPAPNPTPDDDPTPEPPPPAPVESYKWVTIVLDKSDTGRTSWRDSKAIRDIIETKQARIAFYSSDEQDIDSRRLRSLVTEKGLPLVVLQSADGEVVLSRKVDTEADLLGVLK
jgi:hypothetical protein